MDSAKVTATSASQLSVAVKVAAAGISSHSTVTSFGAADKTGAITSLVLMR